MQRILLDTNVLMNRKIGGHVVLPVVQELDRLKTAEGEKGKQARDAIYDIYKNPETYPILYVDGEMSIQENEKVDDYLLRVAEQLGFELYTYDLSLYLKAILKDIDAKFLGTDAIEQENYTGIYYLNNEEYSEVCTGNSEKYPENCYLVFDKYLFKVKDKKAVPINYQAKTNSIYLGEVTPRNPEQKCLMDALCSDVPIVLAGGKPGSGKSYLMLSYALQELAKGRITKLVVVTNNSFTQDSREIGALPGGLLDKELMHIGPLIDILGLDRIQQMVEKEEIEILPISIARGRSFSKSIIWASEAQNLTSSHMKLLVSRIGDKTRLFIDGDIKQADSKKFARNSGIRLLLKLSQTSQAHLFAAVKLQKVERSEAAQLAEVLDDLE